MRFWQGMLLVFMGVCVVIGLICFAFGAPSAALWVSPLAGFVDWFFFMLVGTAVVGRDAWT